MQQRPRESAPHSLSLTTYQSPFKGSIVRGAELATFSHLHNAMQGVAFYEFHCFFTRLQPSRQPIFTFLNLLLHLHHQSVLYIFHQRYGANLFN